MKFSIRDVLWLTVVVALGAGWFVDRQVQQARHRDELAKQMAEFQEMVAPFVDSMDEHGATE